MAVHDWTRVDACIFHAFHHHWICSLCNALNSRVLPKTYYALLEQMSARFGPKIEGAETDHRRKKTRIAIRHVNGDQIVTTIEIAEPGKRSTTAPSAYSMIVELPAAGGLLPDMGAFLQADGLIQLPLQSTYDAAFDSMPERWREVLESPPT